MERNQLFGVIVALVNYWSWQSALSALFLCAPGDVSKNTGGRRTMSEKCFFCKEEIGSEPFVYVHMQLVKYQAHMSCAKRESE